MIKGLDQATLKRLYLAEKKSTIAIAKMFGCSKQAVINRCIKYGIKVRPRGKIIEGLNNTILQKLYVKKGKSIDEIAELFSCSPRTIVDRFRKYSIPPRPRKKKVLRTLFLDLEQIDKLKKLSVKTSIPQATYIREGIDLILAKYERRAIERGTLGA